MWISFHFNHHSPPPERCHPLVHATWPWPADRSKGLQPRLIVNLWHPLHLSIETNPSVFGDNLSMIQYLIVKWKFSSRKKGETSIEKSCLFSFWKEINEPYILYMFNCSLVLCESYQPAFQRWRWHEKLIANYQMNQMDARLNQKKHLQGLDFSNTQILCLVKQTSSWKTPDKSAWKDVYSQISQPQKL